jgi:hypothetical protein
VIFNVQTQYLYFWNGHNARHYDMAYGYGASKNEVRISEEWDPVYVGGSLDSYGGKNPYGAHQINANQVYNAVHFSPTHKLVY